MTNTQTAASLLTLSILLSSAHGAAVWAVVPAGAPHTGASSVVPNLPSRQAKAAAMVDMLKTAYGPSLGAHGGKLEAADLLKVVRERVSSPAASAAEIEAGAAFLRGMQNASVNLQSLVPEVKAADERAGSALWSVMAGLSSASAWADAARELDIDGKMKALYDGAYAAVGAATAEPVRTAGLPTNAAARVRLDAYDPQTALQKRAEPPSPLNASSLSLTPASAEGLRAASGPLEAAPAPSFVLPGDAEVAEVMIGWMRDFYGPSLGSHGTHEHGSKFATAVAETRFSPSLSPAQIVAATLMLRSAVNDAERTRVLSLLAQRDARAHALFAAIAGEMVWGAQRELATADYDAKYKILHDAAALAAEGKRVELPRLYSIRPHDAEAQPTTLFARLNPFAAIKERKEPAADAGALRLKPAPAAEAAPAEPAKPAETRRGLSEAEKRRAVAYVDAILRLDPNDFQQAKQAHGAAETYFAKLQSEAAAQSRLLQKPLTRTSMQGSNNGAVGQVLTALQIPMSALDPSKVTFNPGWFTKLLVKINPWGKLPAERYAETFASSKEAIEGIAKSLETSRASLVSDIDALREDQSRMREIIRKLTQAVEMTMFIDQELDRRIASGKLDPEHVQFLNNEVVFPLKQRILDLQQQLAVNQQGVVAAQIVIENNQTLARSVSRTINTIPAVLQVAALIAQGLEGQREVIEAVNAANASGAQALENAARQAKIQGKMLHDQAAGSMMSVDKLKAAYKDFAEALGDISKFREAKLPQMTAKIAEFDELTRQGEGALQRIENAIGNTEKEPAKPQ